MVSETEYLVKKAKRQDPDAFTQLMQIHMKEMYRVALSILMNDEDAADAIGDTILACWEKIGSLKETAYVRTWMIRILMNKCYDIRKKISGISAWTSVRNRQKRIPVTLSSKRRLRCWMKNTVLYWCCFTARVIILTRLQSC